MYITYSEYTALYGTIEDKVFELLAFDACRYLDRLTTGADGVKKLKVAFPTDEDDSTAVKHCTAEIVNLLSQIREAELSASAGRGYIQTDNGLQGKVISSISAGNESISFSSAGSAKTVIDNAVADPTAKDQLIYDTVRRYLSGVADANGVNLLYMGRYPM